jgi:mono/diheme cytochrome c family protein
MNRIIVAVTRVAVAALAVLGTSVYFGAFSVAADVPHSGLTSRALALVRDRSIAAGAADLTVPNLADRDLIALGAEHYSAMCTGCHLAPGIATSELRQGLYPAPPDFSAGISLRPAEAFWVIKHGIKMSAMPAWGGTHDDRTIWAMVAFLQQLPTLDAKAYAALTGAPDAADHDHDAGDHDHDRNVALHDVPANCSRGEPGGTTMDHTSAAAHAHTHAADNESGPDIREARPKA